jgi:hypothetical protein
MGGEVASCGDEVLYSEGLVDGQSYGDVRVMSPLKRGEQQPQSQNPHP